MKKGVLLNAALSHAIARLGHGDMLVIADAGLPVPPGVPCIDLAVTRGLPGFEPVLQAVLAEMCVERWVTAIEMHQRATALAARLDALLADARHEALPHEGFKLLTRDARAIVRTGEFTPYANIALVAGVVF